MKITTKEAIRTLIRQKRINLKATEKESANKKITETLLSFLSTYQPKIICSYISMPEEVDTRTIIKEAGTKVAVPKINGSELSLYLLIRYDALTKGPFSILQPTDNSNEIDSADIDIFIVPGIAFDRNGRRIGWGKGYYDRLLEKITGLIIGLCYDCQLLSSLPYDSYDRLMDIIITEKETVIINKQEAYEKR